MRVTTARLDPAIEEAFECEEHTDVSLKGLGAGHRVVTVSGRRGSRDHPAAGD